jgi:hypothetical protein
MIYKALISNIDDPTKMWYAEFATELQAQNWINIQGEKPFRRLVDTWYRESDLTQDEIASALDSRVVPATEDFPEYTEYLLGPQSTFEIIDITASRTLKLEKEDSKLKGGAIRKLSSDILSIFTYHILANGMTRPQVLEIKQENSELLEMLKTGESITAKALIDALVPDGVKITQAILDEVQLEYAEFKELYPDLAPY